MQVPYSPPPPFTPSDLQRVIPVSIPDSGRDSEQSGESGESGESGKKGEAKEVKAQGEGSRSNRKETNRFVCELCDIRCSSPYDLQEHVKGKKHAEKKLFDKSVVAAKEKKMRDKEKSSNIAVTWVGKARMYTCKVCAVQCRSEPDLLLHLKSNQHQSAIGHESSKSSTGCTLKQHSQKEDRKSSPVNNPRDNPRDTRYKFYCDVCDVKCITQRDLDFHTTGNKHAEVVRTGKRIERLPDQNRRDRQAKKEKEQDRSEKSVRGGGGGGNSAGICSQGNKCFDGQCKYAHPWRDNTTAMKKPVILQNPQGLKMSIQIMNDNSPRKETPRKEKKIINNNN